MSNKWKVIKVIDGDTIQVSPDWQWGDQTGNMIRIWGYNPNKYGAQNHYLLKTRLESILLNKATEIELKNPIRFIGKDLICEVHVNGHNVSRYFLEYI